MFVLPVSTSAKGKNVSITDLSAKCEMARSLSQYDKLGEYSASLITMSQKEHDKRVETYAYFYNGLAKLFTGKGEESQKMHDKAEELAIETHNDTVMALVWNARGIYHAIMQNNNFIAQQYFMKSLDLAEKLRYEELCHRVKGNLLTLSHSMGDSIAYEIATDVYEFGKKEHNEEQIAMGAYYLATYYYNHDNFVKAEKYLDKAIASYDKYPYEDIASIHILRAKMLINEGKMDMAEVSINKAISLAQKYNQSSMEVDAYITKAEYLNNIRRYEESVNVVRRAMHLADSIGLTNNVIACNQLMAKNYMAMHNVDAAVECLKKANSLLEDKATFNMKLVSHELQIMKNIEKKEMEAQLKQEQIASQRVIMIMLLIIVSVLLVLLIFIITTNRKLKALYKKIVQQNSLAVIRQKEKQEQIELLLKEKEQYEKQLAENGTPAPEITAKKESFVMGDEKIDKLYTELCRLMETERLYTESQLTREKMAERLGTNRTYLIKVIKEKTDMNYLQFVNSYRINEAIKILSDKDKLSYPLKQIWSDLGFSSPSTFFKLFQQTVGITPSTYRKQFVEVNNEKQENYTEDDNLV